VIKNIFSCISQLKQDGTRPTDVAWEQFSAALRLAAAYQADPDIILKKLKPDLFMSILSNDVKYDTVKFEADVEGQTSTMPKQNEQHTSQNMGGMLAPDDNDDDE
jgi:hypothetical protein